MGFVKLDTSLLKYRLPVFNYTYGYLCGGAIRNSINNEEPRDYDICCIGEDSVKGFARDNFDNCDYTLWEDEDNLYEHFYRYTNVHTEKTFDISSRPYQSIDDIFNHSDLTICCFAYNGKELFAHPRALEDLQNKIIRFTKSFGKLHTYYNRLRKYEEYGYRLANGKDLHTTMINGILNR